MLVTRNHIILTPPKCASTSLHTTLGEWNGFAHVYGNYGRAYGPHVTNIIESFRHIPTYLIIRDPYDRVESLWANWCKVYGYVSLDWYCHWLMSEWKDPSLSFFTMQQSLWIAHKDVQYKLVHFDKVAEWIKKEFGIELLHLNTSVKTERLTPALKELIYPWLESDWSLWTKGLLS